MKNAAVCLSCSRRIDYQYSSQDPFRSMETYRLPEDLVIDILSWLPVKSLMRFKSACKSWYALINDSRFVAKHHNKENTGLLIQRDGAFSLVSGETFEVCARVDFPPELKEYQKVHMLASCNGIVCLCIEGKGIKGYALWNPATGQFKNLQSYDRPMASAIGFGFDVKTNDFKVVKIVTCHKKYGEPYLVEVYSLRADAWRKVDDAIVPTSQFWCLPGPVYLNGFCYWATGNDEEKIVLSFDMSVEVFQKIPLPTDVNNYKFAIGVLNDSIALINFSHLERVKPRFQVWKLNEDGAESSTWTKLYTTAECISNLGHVGMWWPLGFSDNGELIVSSNEQLTTYYDKVMLCP